LNIRLLVDFLSTGPKSVSLAFLPVWDNIVARLLGVAVTPLASIVFYLGVLIVMFNMRKVLVFRGFMFVWLSFPVLFALYGLRPSEYYFNYLLPILVLVISFLISKLKQPLLYLFIAPLIYFSLNSGEQLRNADFGLWRKDKIVSFVSLVTKKTSPFDISFSLGDAGDSGFKYLFRWRGVNYSGNPNDPLIQLSKPPDKSSDFIVEGVGISLPNNWTGDHWLKQR
jgi:hypothetical protein